MALRQVTRADAPLLLEWRNDELTRRWSRTNNLVGLDEHVRWLEKVLSDPERFFWVFLRGEEPLAAVRYDVIRGTGGKSAEVSIAVAPSARGSGVATTALAESECELRQRHSVVRNVIAVVHRDNTASRRLFVRAGYELYNFVNNEWIRYRRTL